MHNTTPNEDNTVSQCRAFGGVADECADIVERLDYEMERLRDTICNLETDNERLEQELAELQQLQGA